MSLRFASIVSAVLVFSLTVCGFDLAEASTQKQPLLKREWPFDGYFGKFDRQSIQRGFQVYQEVCAGCHALKRIHYRNLLEIGFSEAEAKAVAASVNVLDGPNDDGEMFERPAALSDRFVAPFANDKAARAANGGALPPDLSLIIKARSDGANYLYSLLNGYAQAPSDMEISDDMHYNMFFPGNQIAMPQPLSDGSVTYQDGTEASLPQMSYDVVNFLQWAAEPELEERKALGLKALLFLIFTTLFFYLAKKRIWQNV
jgi:ubiquinol-cytochrome c reductase cytochrome c1 subunit